MKRYWMFLVFTMLSVAMLQAQHTRPLRDMVYTCRNNSLLSIGITGSFAANDMIYTSVKQSELRPMFGPTFGLAVEWNTLKRMSVGMELAYAQRGAYKSFATEILTSYSTSTFSYVNYTMMLSALELRIPIAYYLGYHEFIRPYLFVAPRLDLWMSGDLSWVRSYGNNAYKPLEFKPKLTDAMIAPFDVSAVAGVGLCGRLMWGRTRFFVKFELSYGISVMSNFSSKEVKAAEEASSATVSNPLIIQGWGDLAHEELGRRYLHNVEARLSLLIPLRTHLKDACALQQ